jgi:type II secretory pathway pseudopilin PulG
MKVSPACLRPTTGHPAGFSLPELALVVFIMLALVTIAIPNMGVVMATARMRASMTSVSGVIQNARMVAVKENRTMTTHFDAVGDGLVAYIKRASDDSDVAPTDVQVHLQAPIIRHPAPAGVDAPAALTAVEIGFTPQAGEISFNSRGLPCEFSAGDCDGKGFLYYFEDTSRPAGQSWAAISVSPAGRIKRWFWLGSSWVD